MSTRLRAIIIWEIIIERLIRQNYHQLETRKTRLCTAGDYEDECFPRILQMLPRSIIQGQTNLKRFVYKRVPLLEDTLKKNLVLFQSLSLSNFFQLCPLFQFYMHSLCFPHYRRRTPLILWVLSFYLAPDLFHELSVVVLKSPINMFSLFAFHYHHALLLLLLLSSSIWTQPLPHLCSSQSEENLGSRPSLLLSPIFTLQSVLFPGCGFLSTKERPWHALTCPADSFKEFETADKWGVGALVAEVRLTVVQSFRPVWYTHCLCTHAETHRCKYTDVFPR